MELQLYRADLQKAGEGVDDSTLLPGAPQQEVQRLHLQDFDIPAVLGDDDTVLDPVDGEVVLEYLCVLQFTLDLFAGLLLVCTRRWGPILKLVPPGGAFRDLGFAVVVDDLEVLLFGPDLLGGELGPQAVHGLAYKARLPPPALIQKFLRRVADDPPPPEPAEEVQDKFAEAVVPDPDEAEQGQRQGYQAQEDDAVLFLNKNIGNLVMTKESGDFIRTVL